MKLLIDYGASRVKSVIYDDTKDKFASFYESGGSFAQYGNTKPVPANFFSHTLVEHLERHEKNVDKIYICSEMHGYALYSRFKGLKTNFFYSWRYQHSETPAALSKFSKRDFYEITKMKLRPGLPCVNIFASLISNELLDEYDFLTLPQVVCQELGEQFNRTCKTLLHSTGFYNSSGEKEQSELITNYKLPLYFPKPLSSYKEPIGYVRYRKEKIEVFFGIGDLQAAFLGLDIDDKSILINMGTGSQIIGIFKDKLTFGKEMRPFFFENNLECITHIPAGRVLWSIEPLVAGYWEQIKNLRLDDIGKSKLKIDFSQLLNPNSSEYLRMLDLLKNSSTNKEVVASVIKGMCSQYVDYLKNSLNKETKIYLNG